MLKHSPRKLGLPYDTWYAGQEQALAWVLENYQQYQVLFLDAPTASGKSLIARAIEKLTGEPGYTVTLSKNLQAQYNRDFQCPIIKGRGNFDCKPGRRSGAEFCDMRYCDDDNPHTGAIGLLAPDCPFVQQFNEGADAPFTVLNYALLFHYLSHPKRPLPKREWLICDEGDLLEDAIGQFVDVYLDRVWFEKVGFPAELPVNGRCKADLLDWCQEAKAVSTIHEAAAVALQWAEAQQKAGQAALRLSQGFILDDDGLVISIRCLWPLERAKELAVDPFQHTLITSATLGDMDALAREMGLSRGQYTTLALPSIIPAKNRPIYVEPVTNLKWKCPEVDYQRMADAIIDWATNQFPGEKGVIHVSSYGMARRLGKLLGAGLGGRVWIQDRRDPRIQAGWEQASGAILISPVAGRGLDLPHLFGWQVIAKVPYPSHADKIVNLRRMANIDWYLRQTANKIVQTAGRVCRTPTDEGLTIIADSSFKANVWKRARNSFPEWFSDAIRWQ